MAVKYDEYFEQASRKYGVDKELLIAVAKTESNINADAVSSAGAVGVMQLMPATASELGVSDRYDAEQNIMGGAKYLSQLLSQFDGNVSLALSAYNAGASRVKENGGVLSYTESYVDKVLENYNGNHSVSTGSISSKTDLVWWGDVVRVVIILLVIACGAVFIVLALDSIGVPTSKADLLQKGVESITDGK